MGYSQNNGPRLVIDCATAPNIQGYQNGTLIWGTTLVFLECSRKTPGRLFIEAATVLIARHT